MGNKLRIRFLRFDCLRDEGVYTVKGGPGAQEPANTHLSDPAREELRRGGLLPTAMESARSHSLDGPQILRR